MAASSEPAKGEKYKSCEQVHQRAAGKDKATVHGALEVNRRNHQGLGARKQTSPAVSQAFVEKIPKHVGEDGDGANRKRIKRCSCANQSFLPHNGPQPPRKVAQINARTSHQKTAHRVRLASHYEAKGERQWATAEADVRRELAYGASGP